MKQITLIALAAALTTFFTPHVTLAGGAGWGDDYKKALEQAKADKKMVLLDFTGSDWCGWCIKLNKEVFSKPKFKEYAGKNLVLVEVDFPQGKKLPKKVQEQNEELSKQYSIQGYPTIVVLDSEGKKIGELGYLEGGPEAFTAELEKLKTKS